MAQNNHMPQMTELEAQVPILQRAIRDGNGALIEETLKKYPQFFNSTCSVKGPDGNIYNFGNDFRANYASSLTVLRNKNRAQPEDQDRFMTQAEAARKLLDVLRNRDQGPAGQCPEDPRNIRPGIEQRADKNLPLYGMAEVAVIQAQPLPPGIPSQKQLV